MSRLVAAELRKITTVPTFWALTAVAVVLAGLLGWVDVHLAPDPSTTTWPRLVTAAAQPVWFIASLMGVLAAAGEFQHQTIRSSLLAVPRRGRLLTAKLVAVAAYAGGLVVVTSVAVTATGEVAALVGGTAIHGGDGAGWWGLLGFPLAAIAVAVIGCALGMLVRSTAFAVGALLLWRFVGEGVTPVLLRRPGAAAWLPGGLSDRLVHATAVSTAWACLAALAAYALVVALIALADLTNRDVA